LLLLLLLLLLLEGQTLLPVNIIISIMAVCTATKAFAVSAAGGAAWGVEMWGFGWGSVCGAWLLGCCLMPVSPQLLH
jgi:hypothetical protein